MDNLNYSVDALEAKCLFYNKQQSVYVEGKDDIIFWTHLFNISDINAWIEDVGGDAELTKYANYILNEDAKFIVATDNDHKDFTGKSVINKRIITTYGYSIENSMYNFSTINEIVGKLGRGVADTTEQIKEWAATFTTDVFDLLKYDIANHKFNKGIVIFGDNCIRFLNSPSSHMIDTDRIEEYIRAIEDRFTEEEIREVENLLQESDKDYWFLIKGHFLTKATVNIIKYLVKTTYGVSTGSISNDMLYSLTVNVTENWDEKVDIVAVRNKINELL